MASEELDLEKAEWEKARKGLLSLAALISVVGIVEAAVLAWWFW